jgi:hypothetical protein
MAPFDRARPLWEAMLVEGLADGRAAYLLKVHHSLADGQGFVQMLDILHSDRPEPGRRVDLPVPPAERVNGTGMLVREALDVPRWAAHELLSTAGRITSLTDRLVSRPAAIADGVRYVRSLTRVLGSPPAPSSPAGGRQNAISG